MAADTAVQQEINQVKQDPSTPSKINAAYSEMIRRASDPSTSEQLVKGVQDLFDRSMAMSSSFERIKLELGKLDERGIKNSDGTPLEKLKPTWAEFQKRYTYTMWGSRDDATAASSVLKDFTEALCPILTDKSVSFADKKEALADFVLGRKIGTRSQAESFTKLFSDIDVFTTKLLNFADLRSTLLTTQIGKLNDDIKALNVQIADCDKQIVEFAAVIAGTAVVGTVAVVAVTCSGAWAALGAAGPGVLIGLILTAVATIIGSLAKLISTLNAKTGYVQSRDSKQAELDSLNKQLQDLQALKASITSMNGEVKQTFARLNDFTNIRAMLYQDAEVLLNYITTAGSIDEPTMLRVQFMQSVYTALMPAVRMYATRVSSSSLPPA